MDGDTPNSESVKTHTFFWKTGSPFSNWHKSNYTFQDQMFTCSEQGMMWEKARLFGDDNAARAILAARLPSQMKRLGRMVRGFKQHVWENNRENLVYRHLYCKFTQNQHLLDSLMNTGDTLLVEASPKDDIWGIGLGEKEAKDYLLNGKTFPGQNLLGKLLTRLRDELKNAQKD